MCIRDRAYTQDELKQQVAKAAVEYVKEGIIGVGTGSTANFFIEELAKVKHKIEGAVASSEATVSYTHLDVYKRQVVMPCQVRFFLVVLPSLMPSKFSLKIQVIDYHKAQF